MCRSWDTSNGKVNFYSKNYINNYNKTNCFSLNYKLKNTVARAMSLS